MSKFTENDLQARHAAAESDPNILGFFFGGSRGKGFEDERSDWDLRYVVRDGEKQNYCKDVTSSHFEQSEYDDMEFQVFSYSEFKEHAVGSNKGWDKYSFAHVTALVDKTGDIQTLIDSKWTLSADEAAAVITKHMDAYVHALYRSMKATVREDAIGSRMQATMSVFHLTQALFAVHQRVAPYPNYLERELRTYPLEQFPVDSGALLGLLRDVVVDGSPKAGQRLALAVENYMKEKSLYSYERWQDKYEWLLSV